MVSVGFCDQKLEGVEAEEDCSERADSWDKQLLSVAVGGNQVEVGKGPDDQGHNLKEDDAGVSQWIKWNLL